MPSDKIIETLAEITPRLASVLSRRSNIMALSDAAYKAVLHPKITGDLSHAERAALAERMARLHKEPAVAAHYAALLVDSGAADKLVELRDPERVPADARRAAIARHTDMLTRAPRDATRGAIEALRDAGVSEPDIVRISELAAFVNYQIRVIVGLRLLEGAA